jgi:IS5 family transposase
MRRRFDVQLALGLTPIERVSIPLKSRDELPPILAGLQWIFQTPEINEEVFGLLESKLVAGRKATGRPGLDLWQILVLGVVRLGLDCDYDRLEDLANHHTLLRQILGVSPMPGANDKPFHYKTLSENVCYLDEELLSQINAIIAQAGRGVFKKKDAPDPIRGKTDSYVLQTNVHYPTDLNLLWDAQRKCLDLIVRLMSRYQLPGWRKAKVWRRQLKTQMIGLTRLASGGGPNKEERRQAAAREYVRESYRFEEKLFEAMRSLPAPQSVVELMQRTSLEYFHTMLIKQMDLVERRWIGEEKIPHHEKVFSLFEPHTEFIKKGKLFPPVELGHKVVLTTDQHELILDYRVMDQQPNDRQETIGVADRLAGRYGAGNIASLSFDKGFSREEDRQLLELYIPEVIMPKCGKRNQDQLQRESRRRFRLLRNQHHAVESDINCLEHHGLDRCPDKSLEGFKRYAGLGVLAYNLHKIGKHLIEKQRPKPIVKCFSA